VHQDDLFKKVTDKDIREPMFWDIYGAPLSPAYLAFKLSGRKGSTPEMVSRRFGWFMGTSLSIGFENLDGNRESWDGAWNHWYGYPLYSPKNCDDEKYWGKGSRDYCGACGVDPERIQQAVYYDPVKDWNMIAEEVGFTNDEILENNMKEAMEQARKVSQEKKLVTPQMLGGTKTWNGKEFIYV
tara:strand:- start:3404 stop:3955 length:552 start_codon:yes stop_codon:yes gene_type:complete